MSAEKKKGLFDKAIDALTDRDEKEAAAQARARALADAAKKEADARVKTAAEKAAAAKVAANRVEFMKAPSETVGVEQAAAPKKGVVTVRSLRIRADHNTASAVVAGLVKGDEVTILSTWSDGRDIWAKVDKGWAAIVHDGEIYIEPA